MPSGRSAAGLDTVDDGAGDDVCGGRARGADVRAALPRGGRAPGVEERCCAAEDAQLESFEALAKWSVLLLTLAVHRESLLHRSRVEPELPADVAFDRDTINAALLLYREHRTDGPAMGTIPTLGRLVTLIAELRGYTGKSSGGPPGLKAFGRGMDHVEVAATVLRLQRRGSDPPT